jgi:hypothetical protein
MATQLLDVLDGTTADRPRPAPARKMGGVWPSNPAVALWGTMVVKKVVMAVTGIVLAREDFGSCTNHAECEAACPKEIPLEFIAGLNRDLLRAAFRPRREPLAVVGAPQYPAHEDT